MKKIKIFFLFLVLVILPSNIVMADTGPKPQMEFIFQGTDEGELQIIRGELYECDQPDCSDAAPLEKLGPQGLYCDTIGCRATAYGFAPYHILEVEFSDEVTRRSNVFETGGFNSRYTVTVQPNDLLVEKKFSLSILESGVGIFACICILGIMLISGMIFFFIRRSKKK